MQACYIERYGDATQLRIGEQPEPQPGPGELTFRMHAASINPIDFKTRAGMVKAILPYKMPLILGSDAAGIVTGLGAGVSHYQIGQRVAATLNKARIGAFAQSVCAHVDQLAGCREFRRRGGRGIGGFDRVAVLDRSVAAQRRPARVDSRGQRRRWAFGDSIG